MLNVEGRRVLVARERQVVSQSLLRYHIGCGNNGSERECRRRRFESRARRSGCPRDVTVERTAEARDRSLRCGALRLCFLAAIICAHHRALLLSRMQRDASYRAASEQ